METTGQLENKSLLVKTIRATGYERNGDERVGTVEKVAASGR